MRPVKMRVLSWSLTSLAALFPLAHADIVQFDFTGVLFSSTGPPDSFQASFLANTAQGSFQYTFSVQGCLGTFSAGLPIYDVNITADGKQVMKDGQGNMGFGSPGGYVACGFYTDDPLSIVASAKGSSFAVAGGFDQLFFNNSESAILGAKDPLALILNPSGFGGINILTCSVPGLSPPENLPEDCGMSGGARAVPEPDVFGLFAAGALGLILSVRKKRPAGS